MRVAGQWATLLPFIDTVMIFNWSLDDILWKPGALPACVLLDALTTDRFSFSRTTTLAARCAEIKETSLFTFTVEIAALGGRVCKW